MPSPINSSIRSLWSATSVKKSLVTFLQNLVGIKRQPANMPTATWYIPSAVPPESAIAPINAKQVPIKSEQKVVTAEIEPSKPKTPPVERFLSDIMQNKPKVVIVWSSPQSQEKQGKLLFSEGVKEQQFGDLKIKKFGINKNGNTENLKFECFNLVVMRNDHRHEVPVMHVKNWSSELKLPRDENLKLISRTVELIDESAKLNKSNEKKSVDNGMGKMIQFSFDGTVPKDILNSIRIDNALGRVRS
ncbi:hypothetical protein MMK73_001438 [Providencia rettgeri]|uniref:hypothetical protein n=1 Tax=Providencia sp. TaxID=589 RepID=UPI0024AA3ACB|nr:hypothetical protein [Providencia rettgeri]